MMNFSLFVILVELQVSFFVTHVYINGVTGELVFLALFFVVPVDLDVEFFVVIPVEFV